VAGGQAQMMFSASLEAKPLLASGRTRAPSPSRASSARRLSRHSDRRRVDGAEDFEVVFWQGMVVLAGTPQPIVDKLQKAIAKVAADPDVIERSAAGREIRSSTRPTSRTSTPEERCHTHRAGIKASLSPASMPKKASKRRRVTRAYGFSAGASLVREAFSYRCLIIPSPQ
jgi:hypothetical protein